MIESVQPRTGAPVPQGGAPVADPSSAEGTDPISGREWITDGTNPTHSAQSVDVQYACIFKIPTPRDCSATAIEADPTLDNSCTCTASYNGTLSHAQTSAVCNDAVPTQEDFAKAYPTPRELLLAKLLGEVDGANPGVVSSLCPIHTTPGGDAGLDPQDPLYGYRPAVNAIANRLKFSL
jgi:hypothetical protein